MTPPVINYARRVLEVKEVHDGDTYRLLIDQGMGDAREAWIRLQGLDTWELSQPEGPAARDIAETLLKNAREVLIQTFKTRRNQDVTSFIRYVADVWVDGVPLKDLLQGYKKA